MSDETPKVIGLRSRSAWVAPTPVEKPAKPTRDELAIGMLEELLERFKAGELQGLIALFGETNSIGGIEFVGGQISSEVFETPQNFLGAMSMMTADINEITLSDFEED